MSDIEIMAPVGAILGEGPVWMAVERAIYWLDIKGREVHRLRPGDGDHARWPLPFRFGSLAPRASGGFVGGSDRGIVTVDPDFATFEVLCDPEAALPGNRFNDGKVDPAGRFWAGTMDDAEAAATGSLYRIDPDGRCTEADRGYSVTNGPAFGPDGRTLYHTDSARQVIYAFDLAADGSLGGKRVFARFAQGDGYPDGMTVDAEGCLWVAFWDGWCLRRLSPDGAVVRCVAVPVARPTSVAFGGAALDELYVTSATIGLDAAARAAQPGAGGLLRIDPGVRGIAPAAFAG